MRFVKTGMVSLLALGLGACATPGIKGPPMPVRLAHVDGSPSAPNGVCDSAGNFTSSPSKAGSAPLSNLELNFSRQVCRSLADTSDAEKAGAMLESGFTLVKVRCNDYFAQKGASQEKTRLTRSLIAPVTALITSVFAVVNFSSEREESDYLALLAAGTTFANAGLRIYEEQFLFNADNISSVRGLTMRALDTHRTAIAATQGLTFDVAIRQLTDHEMICTPASILDLTREAIDKGAVRPRDTSGSTAVRPVHAIDTGPVTPPAPAPNRPEPNPGPEAVTLDVGT